MSMIRRALCLGFVVLMAGCQTRLNMEKTFRLETGTTQTLDVDPPRYDQKVVVTIDTDAAVDVFVYLKNDAEAVSKDLTLKQKSDKVLGSWSGNKSGTIEVNVPAHQVAIVRIDAMQKTANVSVKIVGK
jgi:hypothetical protein